MVEVIKEYLTSSLPIPNLKSGMNRSSLEDSITDTWSDVCTQRKEEEITRYDALTQERNILKSIESSLLPKVPADP